MKKKLLCVILMVVFVLSAVALVACNKGGIEDAKKFYEDNFIKGKTFNGLSYDLSSHIKTDNGEYDITWTSNNENVKVALSADKKTTTVTATRTAQEQTYVLTGTITDGKDSATLTINGTVPANPNAGGQYGQDHYLYFNQPNAGKLVWALSELSSGDLKATETKADAAAWYVEDIENSQAKKLFFVDGTTKKYLGTVKDGIYYNLGITGVDTGAVAAQWIIREDGVIYTTLDGEQYHIGKNGAYYNYLELRPIGDIISYLPVKVTTEPDTIKAKASITDSALNEYSKVEFTSPASTEKSVEVEVGTTVKFKVTLNTDCTLNSVKLGSETLTPDSNGVYSATVNKNCSIVVDATNPQARTEYINVSTELGKRDAGGTANQSVWTKDGLVVTNMKGQDAKDDCTDNPRFYKDSTTKVQYTGMLRVVFTMENTHNAGFNGMTISGAKVLVDNNLNKVAIVFDNAVNEFTTAAFPIQVRISNIEIYTATDTGYEPDPTEPVHKGTQDDPYTAEDAKIVGKALASGSFTQNEVYVKAYVIAEGYTAYNSQYKNITFNLADTADGDTVIIFYRSRLADVEKIPYVGDLVLLKGYLKNYNGTIEFDTYRVGEGESQVSNYATAEVLEVANGSIQASDDNETGVTVTFTSPEAVDNIVSGKNGTEVKFTVAVNVDGKVPDAVKVRFNGAADGTTVEPEGGVYTVTLNGDMNVLVVLVEDGAISDKIVIKDFATANSWADATQYKSASTDNATLTIKGGSNSGKYYQSNHSWRLYSSEKGSLTVTAKNGLTIKSIVITWANASAAKLQIAGSDIVSGKAVDVNGASVEIVATKDKPQITNIEIVYSNGSQPVVTNEAKIGEGENATEYATLAEAVAAAQDNDTIYLLKDVVLDAQIKVAKKITLNLNGKTISNTEDIWDNSTAAYSLIALTKSGEVPAELTITGNGKVIAKENDCYAVAVYWGAKLIIENGEFVGNLHTIYVHTGSAEIKGGKFDLKQLDDEKIAAGGTGHEFTLNLLDASGKDGIATIVVTGGQFVEFDPSASTGEPGGADFVSDGYVVTSSTVEGKTIYTVAAAQA